MQNDIRNRLTNLICEAEGKVNNERPTIEMVADYLLENGVIVLPCKAGDTVYTIHKFENDEVGFCYILEENPSIPIRGVYELAYDLVTGACIFCSTNKLEAEQKLKELKQETTVVKMFLS